MLCWKWGREILCSEWCSFCCASVGIKEKELFAHQDGVINTGGRAICLEIHKLITCIWKTEKLPEGWKESIIVPIHKKRDKTDCNNYRGISLLPATYRNLSNIMLSRLIPYAKEIIGYLQCGFRRNRSTIDHIFCIHQILEKNGIKCGSSSTLYTLQEGLWFS